MTVTDSIRHCRSNDFTDEEEQAQIRIDIQLQVRNRSPASVELPNESGVEEQLLLTLHLQCCNGYEMSN
ncbi:hypothetical protein U1Q18_023439 [Sarracenia purpurea var. burkii]